MTTGISAIIVHYRRSDMTRRLIELITRDEAVPHVEIIVVAVASEDEFSPEGLPVPVRIVRMAENSGYGAACNAGAHEARGTVLLITNNDIEFSGNVLGPMLETLEKDAGIGAAGPMMHFPDGRLQMSYSNEPSLWNGWMERRRQRQSRSGSGFLYRQRMRAARIARDVDWITGAFFAVRKDAFDAVGGFDEAYFMYFEDVDLCRRLRDVGYRIRYVPASAVVHFGGASHDSRGNDRPPAHMVGQLRYYAKFRSRVSFFLLKLYLAAKLVRATLRTPEASTLMREALKTVRRYPFRSIMYTMP